MTIRLHLKDLPKQSVAFSYSVLQELALSLQLLSDYRRYPLHVTWALDTLEQLPEEFQQELRLFRAIFQPALTVLWHSTRAVPTFNQELKVVADWSPEQFVEPLLPAFLHEGPPVGKRVLTACPTLAEFRADLKMQNEAAAWLQLHYPESADLIAQIITDPTALQQRFINMLESYWDCFFGEYWLTLEPHFLKEISRRGRWLYEANTVSALQQLHNKLSLNESEQIVSFLDMTEDEFHFTEQDELHLHPTYFTQPGIIFSLQQHGPDGPKVVKITYPLPELLDAGQSPLPPEELVTLLRAISDRTRLQILQLVAEKARPTNEIASIIGLTDAAVSKHLKQLQAAGWVTSERQSYYVLYRGAKQPVGKLTHALEAIFND